MKLIHYSKDPISSLDNRNYDQSKLSWQAKPNGLWVSVEGLTAQHNYNWKEWCEAEEYRIEFLGISYEITLKESAKILHLKSAQEIFVFSKLYHLKTRDWDAEYDTYQLDWNKVKVIYQGIIIAPYQWECRLALESSWYYGWDCSSGCIWDLTCIKEFSEMNNERGKS